MIILIVESNDLVRETISQMLDVIGLPSIQLSDGDVALSAMAGLKFEVLIAGILPNNPDVVPFLNAAKKLQPSIRIIVSRKYKREADHPNVVDAFVDVPLSLDELRVAVDKVLRIDTTPDPLFDDDAYR